MNNKIFIDIETTGLDCYKDRITCIGAGYIGADKKYSSQAFVDKDEEQLLCNFWKWYAEKTVAHYLVDTVTWNGTKFDVPWLIARSMKYKLFTPIVNHRDLKLIFPQHIPSPNELKHPSMHIVAKHLGLGEKSGDGLQAIYLWKLGIENDLPILIDKLTSYCLRDVEILKDITLKVEAIRYE